MDEHVCWLVTILYGDDLLRCAVKIHQKEIPEDCYLYPMEPLNRAIIHSYLPSHVQSCGPIVAIEEIFDVCVVKK